MSNDSATHNPALAHALRDRQGGKTRGLPDHPDTDSHTDGSNAKLDGHSHHDNSIADTRSDSGTHAQRLAD